jgi:hypothetical protein
MSSEFADTNVFVYAHDRNAGRKQSQAAELALAGTLELLDSEFGGLRRERNILVDVFKTRYQSGLDGKRHLDAARLIALFEHVAPEASGWRAADQRFPPRSDAVCIEALHWVGIRSANDLRELFASAAYRRSQSRFAADNGVALREVSHLARSVLAVAARNRAILAVAFPQIIRDPSLSALLG